MSSVHEGTTVLASTRAHAGVSPQLLSLNSTGAELVAELPENLRLLVWQALRSVLQWALEEPASRGDIFEPNAMREWEVELLQDDTASGLHQYLAVVVGELVKLGDADHELLSQACLGATEWALERKFRMTALTFAEAAALCWPENPRYAWTAGHLMQVHARPHEGEVWLRHAERTAIGLQDRLTQVLALRSRGHIHQATGKDREAGKLYRDALRLARRYDVGEQLGEAAHDLFLSTCRLGSFDEAEDQARTAFEGYRNGSSNLPVLALDVASWWLRHGFYARALTVIQHLPGILEEPGERIVAHGMLSHASGAVGDPILFSFAASEVWTLADNPAAVAFAGEALLGVARGAMHLQHWDEAARASARVVELAHVSDSPELATAAERILARAETARPQHHDDVRPDSPGHGFAVELAAALRNCAPGGPTPRAPGRCP